MADANELHETIVRELNTVVISDTGDVGDERGSLVFQEETISDDFPPSLLSYFETSKSRAAVCEKFILEELNDVTASHVTEDMMNLPNELDEDMVKQNKQVTCETENEENSSSADTHLLPTPTGTEALSIHNEAETDEYVACEEYLDFELRTFRNSMKEEEIKKSTEYQREHRERQHCEEMKREEQRRQTERNFQEELRKMMEAERLQQKELELMEKQAQEKLEQEFLLQQELISDLKKQVERERKMQEEEQKRIKEQGERKRKEDEEKRKREEEATRKREEEMIKREMERKRLEEEMRRRKEDEEERKIKEMRLKEKYRQEKEEDEKKRRMEEEKREKEKQKIKEDLRKKEEERKIKEIRLEGKKRRQVEEEERKRKENEETINETEKNKKREEEERKEKEKKMTDMEKKKREDDKKRKNEEEIELKEEWRDSDDKDKRREEEVRIMVELEVMMKQEQMRNKVEERKSGEEETRKVEKKREEENSEIENMRKDGERGHIIRTKEEKKTKEEDQKEEMRQERELNNTEEEIRPGEGKEKELDKVLGANNREVEHERKTSDKEKRQEEVKKRQEKDGRRNIEADTRRITQIADDGRKNKVEAVERRLREEEESNTITVRDTEKEERVNELQEMKNEINTKLNTENESTENTRNSLTSQPGDSASLSPSSPSPLHSEPTAGPTCSDLNMDTSQTSTCKTMGRQDAAVKTRTSSDSLPVCLPERTEQKRLSWMKDCVPWSRLSLQNRTKQKGCVRSQRRLRRTAEAGSLPPLCLHTLLQSTGCESLQEVTTVTLEDLPGCSLSPLAQCTRLQSLTLRRCGLRSLEGIKQLPQLCYIDAQENDISFVDCENMTSLRVLRLGHNKLTSIHGLYGAQNVDVLEVSHNSITRIAGLESMKRLQRLSVDHNQLISIKGLRDIYTLLHLDCSHNHLASVEGLENSALLQTLDLRANSLTEPPSLNNHILLRELHLDDNSISSLQGLAVCWLPLMHNLSVAQNRITLLHSMSDFVSLANLDIRLNCMSDLQNVCESLEGCWFLREVHLKGNPLQQESDWRSTLQRAVACLRVVDGQETDTFMSAPAVPCVTTASGGCFLTFCQAQLKQACDLQQQCSRELSNASSHLEAVRSSCRHFTETLKLAVDQRFAHEYGNTTVSTRPVNALDMDGSSAEKLADHSESAENVSLAPPSRNINGSYWTSEKSFTETDLHSNHLEMSSVPRHQDPDPKNTAAVMIQQWWRKCRQKRGKISSPPKAEKGGGGRKTESGASHVVDSVVEQNCAAALIQAFWRGFALRRRLASALAAVTCPDSGEDEIFEEVDVDEFVFDEAALEKYWTLPLSEDSPSRLHPVSEEPLSLKPLEPFREPSHRTPPPLWRPKQAWVTGEQVDPTGQRISPESSNRSKSPASSSALGGVSARSERILEEWGFTDSQTARLMLRRAQKMKSRKQHKDPSARLALFRNCNYQRGPAEARNRPALHNRNYMTVCELDLGLRQEEKTEQVTQGQAQRWLHTQSDRDSESEHFLPEISVDILNGGRVQLVADPGYTERLHHASGLWANSNLAAQPSKERNYPRRNSLGHARKEVPSPHRVTSAPLKKERISFRDNPVQLSGGWGGGKKRDKVYK